MDIEDVLDGLNSGSLEFVERPSYGGPDRLPPELVGYIYKKKPVRQVITVELELAEGQKPYDRIERTGPDILVSAGEVRCYYAALHHFFEDIDYKVVSLRSVLLP